MEDINLKDLLFYLAKHTKLNTFLRSTIQSYAQRITTESDSVKLNKSRRSRSTDKNTRYENIQHIPQALDNSTLTATAAASVWQQIYHQTYEYFGFTQLHLACMLGNTDIVATIIGLTKHSDFLDTQNTEGQTALHLAALTEQVNILRMLLLAGANPNLRDHHGNTALHLACMTSNDECVSALIEPFSKEEISNKFAQFRSAADIVPTDLEICNHNGQRCIHLAAQAGYLNILHILLNSGADINAQERKAGRTPLHIAIEMHNDDVISVILKEYLSSVNLITATYAGLTIYQAALSIKKTQFYNLLKT